MKRFVVGSSLAVLAVVVGAALAVGECKSGPESGAGAAPFDVHDVTGPNKGKSLCYR